MGRWFFEPKKAAITAPTDIPGCSVWLDASDSSTMVMAPSIWVDEAVVQWNDKSGNGNNFLFKNGYSGQYSGNKLFSNFLNGKSVIGNVVEQSGFVSSSSVADSTVAAVFNFKGMEPGGYPVYSSYSAQQVQVMPTYIQCGPFSSPIPAIPYTAGSWINLIFSSDIYIDGVAQSTTNENWVSGIPGNSQYPGVSYVMLGVGGAMGATPSYIAEFITYNRVLTSEEIAQLNTYLNTKWGV